MVADSPRARIPSVSPHYLAEAKNFKKITRAINILSNTFRVQRGRASGCNFALDFDGGAYIQGRKTNCEKLM
ncbi:hypothetical protein CONPUDRAFT_137727 [Coniophora puteana RWD-64-598 SS2]|uniref:Uncharacterized protein n=1 Tax=Coniophora puteana (strain RWD-64-598) TaxID=741705 RepID=A0A5M3MPX4_CONPW|nr:uncharacterized protein CONPUDRAFT_137727 [Coniophora puteana RWD-64-598 SS2]EIW80611.1 hypothetical protein CONPUDRAFT_137727 [Coniophora puteana RWD-64-598 SS2]